MVKRPMAKHVSMQLSAMHLHRPSSSMHRSAMHLHWRFRMFMGRALAVGVGLLASSALAAGPIAAQDVIGLPLGTRPDPVEIEDLDGNPFDLGRFMGAGPVFIEFWATWCPACEQLHPAVEAAYERFGDRVEFVTIAVAVNQSHRTIRRHLERHPIPGHVVWDARGRATRAFRAPATSYVVVLDAGGRVAYTGIGGDQDLMAALERVLDDGAGR
jgi:thiol-disulfide isomerase/thioredoxin